MEYGTAEPWRPATAPEIRASLFRRHPHIVWGLAASVLAHVALLLLVHRAVAPPKAPPPAPVTMWLTARVMAATPGTVAISETKTLAAPVTRQRAPVRKVHRVAHTPAPAPRVDANPPAPAAAAAPVEPIDGAVFSLPRIGFGGSGPKRWMTPPDASAPMLPPLGGPPAQAQLQARNEAGKSQIFFVLQQQVSALQAPSDAGDARCALQARPEAQLACDSEALRDVVSAQVASLSGLLHAYRSMDPQADSLSVSYVQGRYQVAIGTGGDLR